MNTGAKASPSGQDAGEGSPLLKQFLAWGIFPHPAEIERTVEAFKGEPPEQALARLARQAKTIAAGQGVVASLPGAIPGLGTAAQLAVAGGTALPETLLLLRKMAHLQLCTAHLYGQPIRALNEDDKIHPDRLEEFMVVLGIMTGVILPAKEAAKKFGTRFTTVQISRHLPGCVLRAINAKVGFTLLTKFGTKRGGVALGRLIPLGVGAAIGGAMNYQSIHQFGKSAAKFYGGSEEYGVPDDTSG
ncbi:hypothetical protein [Deinococcus arcticus]|uniref:EcsC family protein n=1 Tax=Deinococcus arcticus TaxID=2136176 RepID=A0A2T3W3Y5_9DEIO|nr:hypothetical protein [Deinococcus arcticus]PTA66582.1 hypothetical protein C8263_16910 [Deinococcus arcticus]